MANCPMTMTGTAQAEMMTDFLDIAASSIDLTVVTLQALTYTLT